ncbi:unnamed protein product, partial [Discosporangium mesarthrocarpum]
DGDEVLEVPLQAAHDSLRAHAGGHGVAIFEGQGEQLNLQDRTLLPRDGTIRVLSSPCISPIIRYLGVALATVTCVTVCAWWLTPIRETQTKQMNRTSSPQSPDTPHVNPTLGEYDYIVVGGGPSGSVMAKMLSDNSSLRVLLLEAGEPSQYKLGGQDILSDPLTPFDIPLMWPEVSHMNSFHWQIPDHTHPARPSALVAKALGGCGIHNAMLYVRALETDFLKWDIRGLDWESAMGVWKSMEDFRGPGPLPAWHGRGGPIATSPLGWVDEVAPFFLESCKNAGIPSTSDFNEPGRRMGAGPYQFTVRDGIRDSAARALLGPFLSLEVNRTNLEILTGTMVHRVLWEGDEPNSDLDQDGGSERAESSSGTPPHMAMGVEYSFRGQPRTALLRSLPHGGGGVVMTAGALHTPKVLMLSGVGDRDELHSLGLPVKVHSPGVGKNLQDHVSVAVMYELGPELLELYPADYLVPEELERYKRNVLKVGHQGRGGYGEGGGRNDDDSGDDSQVDPSIFSSAGLSVGAFLKSPYPNYPPASPPAPDIQVTAFPRVSEPHIMAQADLRPSSEAPPMMLLTISLLDPEGRGAVCLNPDNPQGGNPYICPDGREGAVSPRTRADLRKLAWGVAKVREIMQTPPLLNLTRGEIYPGPGIGWGSRPGEDDEGLMTWVQSHLYSNSHWCGTARIGRGNVEGAVVDESMGVRGTRRLFVADASVIPFIPNGNVHSTVTLFASWAADLLL